MIVDQQARDRLLNKTFSNNVSKSIDKLSTTLLTQKPVEKVAEKVVPAPAPKAVANPVLDPLVQEIRNLQRVIGGGNLNESLGKLMGSLDKFQLNEEAVTNLKATIADLTVKLKMMAELEAKLPSQIKLDFPEINLKFPKDMPVTGRVEADIRSMPSVEVSNLPGLVASLENSISNLQLATIKAINATKVAFPDSVKVSNEVAIAEFGELLDAMEELKKGFNALLNKEAGTLAFPSGTLPVEIQNWMIPQPVTNVSINPNRGTILSTAVTVTSAVTSLPGTALIDRRSMTLYNNSSTTIYIGGANVATSTGIPILGGTYGPSLDVGPRTLVYGITTSGSADIRVLEMNDLEQGGDQ